MDAYIQNDRNPRVLANLLKSDLTMLDKGVVMETVRRAIMERVIVEVTPSNTGRSLAVVREESSECDEFAVQANPTMTCISKMAKQISVAV